MSATVAMFVDAYRQLNSKKLFWVTLALSGLVILVYASIGFNDRGISMFFGLYTVENDGVREGSSLARLLYEGIFTEFIVEIWLSWIAAILALISTTSIFPDFIAGGAVELVLSKPIGRVRLFFTKYISSLLFVVLQVSLFCVGVFLCVLFRLGDWNWTILAAIPVITVFYSYLYAVNVLVGVVTRSALTALLMTLLFWSLIFSLNLAVAIVLQFQISFTMEAEAAETRIVELEQNLESTPEDPARDAARAELERQISAKKAERDAVAGARDSLARWRRWVSIAPAVLPKTGETVGLLHTWLVDESKVTFTDLLTGNAELDASGNPVPRRQSRDRDVQMQLVDEFQSRSLWYIVGTSLVFEAVILVLACVVFVRRDY